MSETWIKLSLDSNYFVAGDRLTGEVVLKNCSLPSSIILKSQGTEKVILSRAGEEDRKYLNPIFSLSEELAKTQDNQAVYPFTFTIPAFAPSTFHFSDTDHSGLQILAEVFYSLEVSLIHNSQTVGQDSLDLTIYNKGFRIIVPQSNDFNSALSSCWCIPRGSSQIVIESQDKFQVSTKDIKKYSIVLASETNNRLVSVIAQLVLDVFFTLPGEKPIHCRKIISRFVPNIENVKRNSALLNRLEFTFEADLSTSNNGRAPASNKSVLFNSNYTTQVFGIYNVGFRSKRAEAEVPLHVNPVAVKFEKISLPEDWEPVEHHLKSLLISSNSSFHSFEEA